MLMPGNVIKVYKKEVLDNLVSGWNKVGFLSCKIYMEKELGRMKKSLRHMIGGNVVNSFSVISLKEK